MTRLYLFLVRLWHRAIYKPADVVNIEERRRQLSAAVTIVRESR